MESTVRAIAQGARPDFASLCQAWSSHFELLDELADCPQDPGWHAEGDVAIHTAMVLDELYDRIEGLDIDQERRAALVLGALFHDIAKPLTTCEREIDGRVRIVAPRHADRGRNWLAFRLASLELPQAVHARVLAMVGHHHDPKFLVIKDRPARAWHRLARLASLEDLYLLEVADLRGRRCDDQLEQLETLELFRLIADEDHGLYRGQPYAGWREMYQEELGQEAPDLWHFALARAQLDFEAGQIYTPEEGIARSWGARQEGFPRLVVLTGPSGSGKSSWARQAFEGFEIVAMDALRETIAGDAADQSKNGQVFQAAKEQLKAVLRRKGDVIWDATNVRRQQRRAICQLGIDYGAYVTVACFQMTIDELHQRNRERSRQVPIKVLDNQVRNFELPYLDEAHRLLVVNAQGQVLSDSRQTERC